MPPVIRILTWDAAPGKLGEMMALMREAIPLWERHGAQVRIFNNTIAGPGSTTVSFVAEYPSLSAFGAGAEALTVDPQVQAFQAKVGAAMVGRMVSSTLSAEVARS